jgi:hypothetical protein
MGISNNVRQQGAAMNDNIQEIGELASQAMEHGDIHTAEIVYCYGEWQAREVDSYGYATELESAPTLELLRDKLKGMVGG